MAEWAMEDIVRYEVELKNRPRRALDERLMIRMPGVMKRISGPLLRLPARSRLRRAVLARLVQISYDAYNRHDTGFLDAMYLDDTEIGFGNEWFADLGVPQTDRGPEGVRAMTRALSEAFPDMRWERPVVLDAGDTMVILLEMSATGAGSGLTVSEKAANVYRYPGGRYASHRLYRSWEDGLRAAGFPEELSRGFGTGAS